MIYRISAALVIFSMIVISGLGSAMAQDGKFEKNTMTITGQAKTSASPDKASIIIAVETTSKTAEAAVKENAEKTNKVIEVIKDSMGEGDKVSTAGYNLGPVYEYNNETKKSELKGYMASNQIIVETQNLDGLGKLIDGVSKAGSNKIDSLTFDTTNREEYKKKALELAVQDARSTAETVAKAAGVKIVKILSIRPGTQIPMPSYDDYAVRGKMAMAEAAPTPIEPGELTVNATVTIVFEIQ